MRKDKKASLIVASTSTVVLLLLSFGFRINTIASISASALTGAAAYMLFVPSKRKTLQLCRDMEMSLKALAETDNLKSETASKLHQIASEIDRVVKIIEADPDKLKAVDMIYEYMLQVFPGLTKFVKMSASGVSSPFIGEFENEALPMVLAEVSQWHNKIFKDDLENLVADAALVALLKRDSEV